MSANPLSVLIIGCGNIAGGFDAARPAGSGSVTHAGAFTQHPAFHVAACIEPDVSRRQQFMSRWQVEAGYSEIGALPAGLSFDVISVCSPTHLHAGHLQQAIALAPRVIFCEKPITLDVSTSASLVDACASHNILLAVNHTRRWAPDVIALRSELQAGRWGHIRSLTGHYNKGVLNNGTHLVDLIHYLLDDPLDVAGLSSPVWDYWQDDPSLAALLTTRTGIPVVLNIAHAADYALFELQITTEKGVILIEDGGMSWRKRSVIDSPEFKGYRSLDNGKQFPGRYNEAMAHAADNIAQAISSGAPLLSTGQTALQAQMLCAAMRAAAIDSTKRT